jgi:hypothetical protein
VARPRLLWGSGKLEDQPVRDARVKFYINVPISADGLVEVPEELRKVDSRVHASEMFYQDAACVQGIAQERWPNLEWRTEHARTRKFLVIGETKNRK